MENLEMLVVNENGQMEINFDALELITSEEFVSYINETISHHVEQKHEIKSVFVENNLSSVYFYLYIGGTFYTFYFQRGIPLKQLEKHTRSFGAGDARQLLKLAGVKNV